MAQIARLLGLVSLSAVVAGLAVRQTSNSTSLLYKFTGDGAWAENIAVRPNGHILVTRMDNGQLWSIDPATKNATLVGPFPTHAIPGITEVRPDVFAVVAGDQDTKANTNVDGSYGVWTVDMNTTPVVFSKAKSLPSMVNVNGIATYDNNSVLVGDIAKGTVACVTLSGGNCGGGIADAESMGPPATGPPYGIDGMKFRNHTLWFSNIGKKTFNKVPTKC